MRLTQRLNALFMRQSVNVPIAKVPATILSDYHANNAAEEDFAMPFNGTHDEEIMHNADLFRQLEEIVDGLEVAHRQAECMRRDMVKRLSDAAESRDFWDNDAAEKLRQLEYYRTVLEMWRKGIPVKFPSSGDDDRIKVCTACGREGLVGRCCGRDTWRYKELE
jgi:hypothetical protein